MRLVRPRQCLLYCSHWVILCNLFSIYFVIFSSFLSHLLHNYVSSSELLSQLFVSGDCLPVVCGLRACELGVVGDHLLLAQHPILNMLHHQAGQYKTPMTWHDYLPCHHQTQSRGTPPHLLRNHTALGSARTEPFSEIITAFHFLTYSSLKIGF